MGRKRSTNSTSGSKWIGIKDCSLIRWVMREYMVTHRGIIDQDKYQVDNTGWGDMASFLNVRM